METYVLKTKLKELLKEHQHQKISLLAESIGIAPNTLRTLLRDDWDQLARDTIERVCDRFGVTKIGDLFELVKEDFWAPFKQTNEYYVLRGSPKGRIEPRDENAKTTITRFFGK